MWMKKESSDNYWQDLVDSFYLGDHSQNHCRASAPLLVGLLKTHTAGMRKLRDVQHPLLPLWLKTCCRAGAGRRWMLPGDLLARVCACHRPDSQLEKDINCVEIESCYGMSCTSRFRLQVKESRDMSRRRGVDSEVRLRWCDSLSNLKWGNKTWTNARRWCDSWKRRQQ